MNSLLKLISVPRGPCGGCVGVGSKPFEGKSTAAAGGTAAGTEGGGGGAAAPSGGGGAAAGWEGARRFCCLRETTSVKPSSVALDCWSSVVKLLLAALAPPSRWGGLLLGVKEPWGAAAAEAAAAASLAASSAPFRSSRSRLSLKSLLSDAVSHSSLAWSEEFWLDKSGDLVPTAAAPAGLPVSGEAASAGEERSVADAAAAT
ncbi:hypothetical protein EYF80_050055 [Liparis tanakae]|uniref:Uncharacterized protein n=1 Tax=Liparis tanakae TaxID=230148 RepID=A0A4Z2FEW7_9TELE|nr:hypothetical protein EYF80_050055 [Liparis tanakae]